MPSASRDRATRGHSSKTSQRCNLRLFVYTAHLPKMEQLLNFGRHFAATPPTEAMPPPADKWARNISCLEHHCSYGSF
eukprot:2097888-Prymnesium_polylepis.1